MTVATLCTPMALHQHKQQKDSHGANSQIVLARAVSKNFPAYHNHSEEFNPRNFVKCLINSAESLYLGDTSIADLRRHDFTSLDHSRATQETYQNEIAKPNNTTEEERQLEQLSEMNQELIDETERHIQGQVVAEIRRRLGSARQCLLDEITSLFATKAFIGFNRAFNQHITEKHQGLLMSDSPSQSKITLVIPENPKKPVQVVVDVQSTFNKFYSSKIKDEYGMFKMFDLPSSIALKGRGVYTISKGYFGGASISTRASYTLSREPGSPRI